MESIQITRKENNEELRQADELPKSARRSYLETNLDIIAVIAGTKRPTHVMYKSNVSWSVLRNHLEHLEKKGYVAPQWEEGNRGRKYYVLTGKAMRALELLKLVADIRAED